MPCRSENSEVKSTSEINKKSRFLKILLLARDLELYVTFIEELSLRYHGIYGHKKAISQLVGVSTNRISEWQRIWSAAKSSSSVQVQQYLAMKDISLSELVDALQEDRPSSEASSTSSAASSEQHLTSHSSCSNPKAFSRSSCERDTTQQTNQHDLKTYDFEWKGFSSFARTDVPGEDPDIDFSRILRKHFFMDRDITMGDLNSSFHLDNETVGISAVDRGGGVEGGEGDFCDVRHV